MAFKRANGLRYCISSLNNGPRPLARAIITASRPTPFPRALKHGRLAAVSRGRRTLVAPPKRTDSRSNPARVNRCVTGRELQQRSGTGHRGLTEAGEAAKPGRQNHRRGGPNGSPHGQGEDVRPYDYGNSTVGFSYITGDHT